MLFMADSITPKPFAIRYDSEQTFKEVMSDGKNVSL